MKLAAGHGITRRFGVFSRSSPILNPFSCFPTLVPSTLPLCTQVLAASGSELQVVHGEAGGQPQLGPLVDMAVYSK